MKRLAVPLIRLSLLSLIIPLIMGIIVYQGFSTNYTSRVFSEQSFKRQYESGVYKYRVLGRVLLLETYERIKQYNLPVISPTSLKLIDPQGNRQFYSAYFYVNTFFLCLTCLLLFFIFGGHRKNAGFLNTDLPILFLCSLMALSQYTVVPYDTLTYFFLSAAALIIQSKQRSWNILALGIIVVLATLTRETAALILAFYFAQHYKAILTKPSHFKLNKEQGTLLLLTICFAMTYAALRLTLGFEHALFQTFTFPQNYNIFSLAGILFFVSLTLLLLLTQTAMNEMLAFLIAALPYIILMLLVAAPWEIRLWIPLILLLTIMKVKTIPQNNSMEDRTAISPAE